VAKDGADGSAHRVWCPDGHQEQRLAGRRVAVPIGRTHQPAKRSVIFFSNIRFITAYRPNYYIIISKINPLPCDPAHLDSQH